MTHISAVSSRSFFRRALDWANESSEEPLRLLRMAIGGLLLFGTTVAVVLAITGILPRALALVGIFWALYGFLIGLSNGVLEPLVDGFFSLLANFGLERVRGYSEVETLVARGRLAEAAEAYRLRAQAPADRTEATLRRAALLAGPLDEPETAAVELSALRLHPLPAQEDLRVGLALADLYDRRLGDPGRAMGELRRLIDSHPEGDGARRLRQALAELKRS